MRQQSFQKALSKMTETGFRLFFVASLLFAGLTACYNRWLCLAELVLVLILYLYFQTGITRRKKEVMVYLDHMTSGVDAASRRTMITSPLPIVIFRPDTDDIIWSNERFLHLTPSPFRWGRNSIWSTATWCALGTRMRSWPPPTGWM